MAETYFIEFERGDKVRIHGSVLDYIVISINLHGEPKYNPQTTTAIIEGAGVRLPVPVSALELAT